MKLYLALILCLFLICPVFGELQYFQEPPQNNPLDLRVNQGDTIYLGKTYDLSGVFGVTGQLAYWKNWKLENVNCNPDIVVDINYYRTRVNESAVYLSPKTWTLGNWYYWDAWECTITHYDFETHQVVQRNTPFDHDNKFAFKIISPGTKYFPGPELTITPIEKYSAIY